MIISKKVKKGVKAGGKVSFPKAGSLPGPKSKRYDSLELWSMSTMSLVIDRDSIKVTAKTISITLPDQLAIAAGETVYINF